MLGEYIRIERIKKGLSQENMAFMLDISQAAYSKIESEQTTMTLPRLFKIAKILDLDMNVLLEKANMNMITDLSDFSKWWILLKLKINKLFIKKYNTG